MKTTVSAAFLMILATYECGAQQDFWQFRHQLQPLESYQSEQNQGMQPQSHSQYSGGAAEGNQPLSNSQAQGVDYAQRPGYWQPKITASPGYQNQANTQSRGQQYSGQSTQRRQPFEAAAAGYGADGASVNPSTGSLQQFGPKSTVEAIWKTPDPRVTQSTTPGSRPTATSRWRPKTSYSPDAPSDATTQSKRWKTTKKPSVGSVADAVWRTTTARGPPSGPPMPLSAAAPPSASADRVVFERPGGNTAGSVFNALDVVDPNEGADSGMDINKGLRQFALDMLMDMTHASPGKNVVFSPYSVWAVMLVIYEGAEGQTAAQIASTLRFKDKKSKVRKNYRHLELALQKANNESHSTFVSGNGIFYDGKRPPMPEFQQFALSDYQCELQPIDFSKPLTAVKAINDWVSLVTHDRIKMLVKPEDISRPELIITNALFFKGQWKIPFNLSATHTDKFYDEKKQHIANVRMMYQKGEYMYSFITEIGAHVLDMPYEDSKFRMLVVLPKPSSTVAEVLRLMKAFPVDQCYERLVHEQEMFSEDEVHVYLPRFKFGNRVELRPNLERLGITDVFSNVRANLSSMSMLQLFLGKVIHVSEIEVTEEGTIASAATGAGFVNKMGPPKFLANRPFAYFIVENSQKTVIFAGKVADPTKSSY